METIIVGAGMAGLSAAAHLRAAGQRVTIVDKGRRHGGRMATRRVDDAVFDTGVLDFAALGPKFRAALEIWQGVGAAVPTSQDGSPPRWRGRPTMRSLPTAMGDTVTAEHAPGFPAGSAPAILRLATTVTGLVTQNGRWHVTISCDGETRDLSADALMITAPAPQTLALLRTSEALAGDDTLERLAAVTYIPSFSVLARPTDATTPSDGIGTMDLSGQAAGGLARIHENTRTGASPAVAFTLQATEDFSAANLDGDRAAAAALLAAEAAALTGIDLDVAYVHGWRFAQARAGVDLPALRDDAAGAPLVLAGESFEARGDVPDGVRPEGVERAFLSARAGAALLIAER